MSDTNNNIFSLEGVYGVEGTEKENATFAKNLKNQILQPVTTETYKLQQIKNNRIDREDSRRIQAHYKRLADKYINQAPGEITYEELQASLLQDYNAIKGEMSGHGDIHLLDADFYTDLLSKLNAVHGKYTEDDKIYGNINKAWDDTFEVIDDAVTRGDIDLANKTLDILKKEIVGTELRQDTPEYRALENKMSAIEGFIDSSRATKEGILDTYINTDWLVKHLNIASNIAKEPFLPGEGITSLQKARDYIETELNKLIGENKGVINEGHILAIKRGINDKLSGLRDENSDLAKQLQDYAQRRQGDFLIKLDEIIGKEDADPNEVITEILEVQKNAETYYYNLLAAGDISDATTYLTAIRTVVDGYRANVDTANTEALAAIQEVANEKNKILEDIGNIKFESENLSITPAMKGTLFNWRMDAAKYVYAIGQLAQDDPNMKNTLLVTAKEIISNMQGSYMAKVEAIIENGGSATKQANQIAGVWDQVMVEQQDIIKNITTNPQHNNAMIEGLVRYLKPPLGENVVSIGGLLVNATTGFTSGNTRRMLQVKVGEGYEAVSVVTVGDEHYHLENNQWKPIPTSIGDAVIRGDLTEKEMSIVRQMQLPVETLQQIALRNPLLLFHPDPHLSAAQRENMYAVVSNAGKTEPTIANLTDPILPPEMTTLLGVEPVSRLDNLLNSIGDNLTEDEAFTINNISQTLAQLSGMEQAFLTAQKSDGKDYSSKIEDLHDDAKTLVIMLTDLGRNATAKTVQEEWDNNPERQKLEKEIKTLENTLGAVQDQLTSTGFRADPKTSERLEDISAELQEKMAQYAEDYGKRPEISERHGGYIKIDNNWKIATGLETMDGMNKKVDDIAKKLKNRYGTPDAGVYSVLFSSGNT